MFPPCKDKTVYCAKCWWADEFNPLAYGQDFDFDRPFFEQMKELMGKVPLPHMIIGEGENADYTNYSWANRNCYLVSASDYSEDCYFSTYLFRCKDCFDCLFVNDSELCYQCVDSKKCYGSSYLQNCESLTDCYFCFDCRSCENCLGCVSLRRKKYCIFNKEYSKPEYEKKKKEFFEKYKNLEDLRKQFAEFKLKFPHKFVEIENCENCSGDHLMSCKNVLNCFDMVESEDCRNCALGLKSKDCYDCNGATSSELCYQSIACPENYGLKFCAVVWPKSTFLNYCVLSRASNYCFGCVSLLKNEYCILNKQYTKEEYEKLVPKIIEYMKKTGEYGEFFPTEISPFSYNETLAQDYYPLNKEEVLKNNWKWRDDESEKMSNGLAYEIPENIEKVDEEICKKILICETSGKPYKIIPQEVKFYRKMKLPIPRKSPIQRHKNRMSMRNPRELWERKCENCGTQISTSYDPKRPEKIYCESCYLKEIH